MSKKLLLFSYDFPPSTGGIARLCHEIVVEMQQYYQRVIIMTPKRKGVAIPYNRQKNIEIIELPNQRGLCEWIAIQKIRRIKNKNQYDVLCGLWHPDAALALTGGMPRIFVLAHGAELLSGGSSFKKHFWLSWYAKRVLKKMHRVIANSHYTAGLVQKINPKAKVIALPLAVNHHFFKPLKKKEPSDKIRFCTVSRVLQFKGHDFILESLCTLPEPVRKKIEWHIAGTGAYLKELQQQVNNSLIADQVFFHGFVRDISLPQFYNQADIFILATREQKKSTQVEGFGLVFLEAQACGIPVIGANTGGIPDAIEQYNGGWLVEQDNKLELQNLIINLLKNPHLIVEQGKKARKRVESQATWSIYGQELYKILSV